MKNIIKKIFAVAISLMICGSMAACGNSSSQNTKTEDGKIVVEYWYGLGGNLGDNMNKIIEDFNKSQDKYIIKGVPQDDYDTTFKNLQAAMAGNKKPGLVIIEPNKVALLSKKNMIEDLSERASKDSDYKEENYMESFFSIGKMDNKLVAFPAYGTTQLMYYNKEAFADAGIHIEDIKTWTDFSEAVKKLTKRDGDKVTYYGWEPMWGEGNLIDASLSNGASFLSEDGKTVTINSDEWVEVWESFRKYIHEDKTMRVHSGGQGWEYWYSTIDDVMKDKAAGYTGSSGDQGDLDFTKLGALEQPAFKEGKEAKPIATAKYFAVPAGVDKEVADGAYEFIKYFTKADVNAKWSINSGYIAVNKLSMEDEDFKNYVKENPQALVPTKQAVHATATFMDPTDGKIVDTLKNAADKVELENVAAKKALDEAQKIAQKELDKVNK